MATATEKNLLEAQPRTPGNKNAARRVRRGGQVPGVLYGAGKETLSLSLDPRQVARILHSQTGYNTIFELALNGGERTQAMIVDWQYEPVKGALLHIDLKRIAMDRKLKVEVPIVLKGEAAGVKQQGGILEQVLREVEVECLPGDIPASIEADVSELVFGKVLRVEDTIFAHPVAEDLAKLIVSLAKGYSHVLAPATTFGKNIMPRVAALLDVAQISDISGVVSPDTFKRPIYAGNAIATVQSADAIKIVTVRATAFPAAAATGGSAAIDTVAAPGSAGLAAYAGSEITRNERPELTSARIVVSGGRGMQSGENFKLLESLADKLGAAVGASRAAINKDEEAPIFQIADYGLVGDLFEIVPSLDKALSSGGAKN